MLHLPLVLAMALILLFAARNAPKGPDGARHLLTGYSFVLVSFFLYALLPAFLLLLRGGEFYWAPGYEQNHGYDRALLLTIGALLSFMYGSSLAGGRLRETMARPIHRGTAGTHLRRRSDEPRSEESGAAPTHQELIPRSWALALTLVFVGLALRFYVVTELGGVGQTLARLSGGARTQLSLEGASATLVGLRTLAGLADVGATWLLVSAIRTGRGLKMAALIFAVVLSSSFLVSGKRLVVILPLVVVACAVHVYKRPVTYRMAPAILLLVPLLGMATLLIRVFLPASQADIEINLDDVSYAHGSMTGFYFNSLEFSSTEMVAVAMQSDDEINSMLGGNSQGFVTTNITPFSYSIPGALFPGKPDAYVDMAHGISAVVDNISIRYATVGYACTLVGTAYITAGVPAVVVIFMLLGFVVRRYDNRHPEVPRTFGAIVVHALVLTFLFQYFRQGTLGWTFIVAIFQQYGFLIGAFMLRDRRRTDSARGQAVR